MRIVMRRSLFWSGEAMQLMLFPTFHRHPEVRAKRGPRRMIGHCGGRRPTDLGFTRDRHFLMRGSAAADLRGSVAARPSTSE